MKKILNKFLASTFLSLVFGFNTSYGQLVTKTFQITSNFNGAVSDLEIIVPGGSPTAIVIINPPGCPLPTYTPSADTVMINWVSLCVLPGQSVTVKVTATTFSSGYTGHWTLHKIQANSLQ